MSAVILEQQVNLYEPILGRHRRLFSARAMLAALALLAIALLSVAGFGARRLVRVEHMVAELQQRQSANLDRAARAGAALQPTLSLSELDAEAARMSREIDARQQALAAVRNANAPGSSFVARLEALARQQLPGLWLQQIVVSSGAGQLALAGRATDARLVPAWLVALAGEPAFSGVRFDQLAIRRASAQEAPALSVFELDGPDLRLKPQESAP